MTHRELALLIGGLLMVCVKLAAMTTYIMDWLDGVEPREGPPP